MTTKLRIEDIIDIKPKNRIVSYLNYLLPVEKCDELKNIIDESMYITIATDPCHSRRYTCKMAYHA